MTTRQLLGLLAAGGLTALLSCDTGPAGTAPDGLDATDCPYGTFRPMGISDCVFSTVDANGQEITMSDDRCAFGQPAIPPQCVNDAGQRAYLSTSTSCAPGYRFLPGACNRQGAAGAPGGTAGVSGGLAGAGGGLASTGAAGTT